MNNSLDTDQNGAAGESILSNKPDRSTGLTETQIYLNELATSRKLITIRELLNRWGNAGRGRWINAKIRSGLSQMGLTTTPPFEVGPIDSFIQLRFISNEEHQEGVSEEASSPDEEGHILSIGMVPSAGLALNTRTTDGLPLGTVSEDTSIGEALITMMKNDYSQLPVLYASGDRWKTKGCISWESYGRAFLLGKEVVTVADAMRKPLLVNFEDDLTTKVASIIEHDYAIVQYDSRFAGIVTVADLTQRFEQLALPFLLIGRCEREIKRVADEYLGPFDDGKSPGELTEGQLAHLYKNKWDQIPWLLPKEQFFGWLIELSKFRNKIAHFGDLTSEEIDEGCASTSRMTEWLESVETTKKDDNDPKE